jgi:hypothetical protein
MSLNIHLEVGAFLSNLDLLWITHAEQLVSLIYYHVYGWLIGRGWIGWLDLLYLVQSHSSGLHVMQRYHHFQPSLVVARQRIMTIWLPLQITYDVFLSQPNSCHFFTITFDCHLQNSTEFSSDYCSKLSKWPSLSLYNPSARAPRKTPSSVNDACLLVRYLAMDVLLSRARVLRECVYWPVS